MLHNLLHPTLEALLGVVDGVCGCSLEVNGASLEDTTANCQANKDKAQPTGRPFRQLHVEEFSDHHHTQRHNGPVRTILKILIFTQCPLTTDHAVLLNLFKDIQSGMIEDGTAIGVGLANAVSRIKDSQAKSKVIILLTDGSNNRGEIAPVTAAEIARTFGIRVYTIGVGTQGEAPYPFRLPGGTIQMQMVPVDIDEPTLQQIASITGGQYFRATNNSSLKSIYAEIDKMEKTKISVREFSKKQEEYTRIALVVLGLLLIEWLLRITLLKRIP